MGNYTQGEKRGRVLGVLSASLPLSAQEDPEHEGVSSAGVRVPALNARRLSSDWSSPPPVYPPVPPPIGSSWVGVLASVTSVASSRV
eukprot:9480551-Pyramimonas_sp.AAC.1